MTYCIYHLFPVLALAFVRISQICSEQVPRDIILEKPRIMGGYPCAREDYTQMVSIRSALSGNHMCGGTLINKDWVLTAAHCYTSSYGSLFVVAGIVNRNLKGKQFSRVSEAYIHENFNEDSLQNDIALMQLETPIHESKYVNFTKLPNGTIREPIEKYCIYAMAKGWGITEKTDTPADLMCVNLQVIDIETCQKLYTSTVFLGNTKGAMCTLSEGKDACQGDSGGPLICGDTQSGIVSFGVGCADPMFPGVYTRVDVFLDFIEDVMRNRARLRQSEGSRSCVVRIQFLKVIVFCCIVFLRNKI